MITKVLDRNSANMRLDRYLRQAFPNESLSALFAVLRKKKVRVNGIVAKGPLILNEGDSIFFDSTYDHVMEALSDKPVKLLAVVM